MLPSSQEEITTFQMKGDGKTACWRWLSNYAGVTGVFVVRVAPQILTYAVCYYMPHGVVAIYFWILHIA